jgi:hypothetical protein
MAASLVKHQGGSALIRISYEKLKKQYIIIGRMKMKIDF